MKNNKVTRSNHTANLCILFKANFLQIAFLFHLEHCKCAL